MRILRSTGVVMAPRDRLFNLLEDPRMADRLNPTWLRTEVLRAPWLPKPGETTELRVHHRGVGFEMDTAIAEYRRGSFLLERQVRGPFLSFEHAISLEDEAGAEGGSRLTEVLAYSMRLGPLGRALDIVALRPDLDDALRTRLANLKALFELG